MPRKKVIIMGAAGRDFHNFNVFFRDNEEYEVVAFTATQIPHIHERPCYPPQLAGTLYPQGIPIGREEDLEDIAGQRGMDLAVFSYSDVPYVTVMQKASRVMAAGGDFMLLCARSTWIESGKPVISICATRTGSGKSQTTRRVCEVLESCGKKPVVIRHPMPYGSDLAKQTVQRFASREDLTKHECTIEEREEYELHIERGWIVYAGVDYGQILKQAEAEADIVIWDGGNNDLPFYKPDLHIVVVDPHRAQYQTTSYPGEINLRMADVIVINKIDTAPEEGVGSVLRTISSRNPEATIIRAESPTKTDVGDEKADQLIAGKRVLVIEDGPTVTHGDMTFGAGTVVADKHGAAECIDPHPFAVGEISKTLAKYKHIHKMVPAMGYGDQQVRDLEATIAASGADALIMGTPADLRKLMDIAIPVVQVTYELKEIGKPDIRSVVEDFLEQRG